MDLREYARVLLRRGWVIVLIALIGGLGAIAFSKIQQPIYSSTITLGARPARPADYGSSLAIKNLINYYGQQLQTKALAQKVVDQLQLDIPATKFLSELSVAPQLDDLTLTIQVKDPNVDMVGKMAQTLAETYVIQHQQENLQIDQQDRILVDILDNASAPELFSPKTKVNAAAGAILGGLVGAFVIFVLEFLQSAYLRRPEDVERYLGLTVLGTVPTVAEMAPNAGARAASRKWFWQRA